MGEGEADVSNLPEIRATFLFLYSAGEGYWAFIEAVGSSYMHINNDAIGGRREKKR